MQRPHQQRTAPTIEDRVMYTEQASEVIIRQFDQANTVQSALLEDRSWPAAHFPAACARRVPALQATDG